VRLRSLHRAPALAGRYAFAFGIVLAVALAAALSGCASSYRAIDYDALAYTGRQESGGVTFAYRYDAQGGAYGVRARRLGYAIVAVEATNTTDAPVVLDDKALAVRTGGRVLYPVSPATVADETRQAVWTRLLWGLVSYPVESGDHTEIVLPVGLPVAVFNIAMSRSANRLAARSYAEQSLFGQTVAPGQTTHGLLFLETVDFVPLTFRYTPSDPGGTEGE